MACILCNSDKYEVIESHKNDSYCIRNIRVTWVICMGCGFVYQNPILSSDYYSNLYSSNYAGFRVGCEIEKNKPIEQRQKIYDVKWLTHNGSSIKNKLVLDIGCGTGTLLDEFEKHGCKTYGIEPTPLYAELCRCKGHDVKTLFVKDMLTNPFNVDKFDIITIHRTLEHLLKPIESLKIISKYMHPTTKLYIIVPNVFIPKDFDFFVAPHLWYFCSNTLERLLNIAGFTVTARNAISWDLYFTAAKSQRLKPGKDHNYYIEQTILTTKNAIKKRYLNISLNNPKWALQQLGILRVGYNFIKLIMGAKTANKIKGKIR